MWGDERFRHLSAPAPCGRYLWVFLLTGPHTTNVPGIIPVAPAVIGASLGWGAKAFGEAFGEALREGLAKADDEAGLIWLPKAHQHNKPESPNVVRSWRVTWDLVPECALKEEAWRTLKAFAEGLGKGFAEAFGEACRQPSRNQEQEQEQEEDICGAGAPRDAAPDSRSDLAPGSPPELTPLQVARQVVACLNREAKRAYTANDATVTLIKGRMAAGATLDDFEAVIRHKAREWGRDEKMAKYLRPATLFQASKFPGYLDEARAPATLAAGSTAPSADDDYDPFDWAMRGSEA